jgi:hypothetical protein
VLIRDGPLGLVMPDPVWGQCRSRYASGIGVGPLWLIMPSPVTIPCRSRDADGA